MQDSTATYFIIPDSTAATGSVVQDTPLPMDSAFVRSSLELPRTGMAHSGTEADGIAIGTAVGIAILSFIIVLNKFLNIQPYLLGCLLRWKESVHVEDSMQIRRSRNQVALALVLPFCLLAARYSLLPQTADCRPLERLAVTFIALTGYVAVRALANLLGKTIPCKKDVYDTATSAARTFFCIFTILALIIAGIMSVAGASDGWIRTAVLYTLAAVYFVFLVRKSQIFKNSCSLFYTFLYLCTLEILPASILVATVMFL